MYVSIAFRLVIFVLLFVLLVWILKRNEDRAGKLLLMLPPSKPRRIIFTVLCLSSFIVGSYLMSSNNINFYFVIGGGMCGYATAIWTQNCFTVELRENGLVIAGSLVKWSRIKSYEWKSLELLVLKYKLKHLNWQRKWTVNVSSAKRERVEQILIKKLTNT